MGSMGNIGGIARAMSTDYFYKWLKMHMTDGDLELIVKAHNDVGTQLSLLDEIFMRNDFDSATDDIYVNERKALIRKLEDEARSNSRFRNMLEKAELGFAPEEIPTEAGIKEAPSKEKEPTEGKRVIKQRSVKGNYYERTYAKWTPKEKIYLKARMTDYKEKKISMLELGNGLKSISGNERTSSSISTKMRRIRNED